jgi:Zn-dependent peptidase ImmA (M78 family)
LPGHEDESRVCSEEEIETPEGAANDVKQEAADDRLLEQAAHKFASRLLMPSPVIGRIVKRLGISIQTCELVSHLFQVSLTAAAARCVEEDESQYNGAALVVSKKEMVKYFVKSTTFSEYIEINRPIPLGSLAKQLSARGARKKAGRVSAHIWTDTSLPAVIWEESILLPAYDTVVTLLRF